ncbi:NADH-cytochrome b5 reductase-like [Aedes aegypti]|uniref:FAD-binding FR-type domain-containing protein n=1 Tax=Aedes aegypti TaxID=7159 RepID=A0A1S4FYA9_AEDAE|nr:NADH-cytochrome b5 reductase-like [Aedes aegypti]
MASDDELPKCCGSGCTNCVLDRKTKLRKLPSSRPSLLDDAGYQPFQCTAISQCSSNTFLFRFRYWSSSAETTSDDASKELSVPPGSHLMLRAPRDWRQADRPFNPIFAAWRMQSIEKPRVQDGGAKKTVEKYDKNERDLYFSRPYTPIRVDSDACEFDVLIRMEVHGEMSEYLQTMHVNDVSEWKGVYTGFLWVRNARRNLLCIAQGVGLAPIYSILSTILDDEDDETRLNLIYCCRDIEGILLRDKLLHMSAYWNFKATIYLSREGCSCGGKTTRSCSCLSSKIKYGERILNHRLEEIDIENLLHKSGQQDSLQVLICGAECFTKFVENCLAQLNVREIFKF